ncbi:MAG: hypothetical protein ACK5PZ_15900, partial [Pirellula sp.]
GKLEGNLVYPLASLVMPATLEHIRKISLAKYLCSRFLDSEQGCPPKIPFGIELIGTDCCLRGFVQGSRMG